MNNISDKTVKNLQNLLEFPDFGSTKYRLISELGRGGMGVVYKVFDTELKRHVAVKVINLSDSVINKDIELRLQQEAHIISNLEHPGIIPIYDIGKLSDGRIFYVMKMIQGQHLGVYATTAQLKERLQVFLKICDAVAFAHSKLIIHRDLKPENIMVGDFGEVLVMDWGIAKSLQKNGLNQKIENITNIETKHGVQIGTKNYMAPEQIAGKIEEVDQQTDIFALGAILYFLHKLPIIPDQKDSAFSNLRSKKYLNSICQKALSKDKTDRYCTIKEFITDIENFIQDLPISTYKENIFEKTSRWVRKNQFVIILLLTYVIIRFFIFLWTNF